MNLNLTNLSQAQMINILTEIAPISELTKLVEHRYANRELTDAEIIEMLKSICTDHISE